MLQKALEWLAWVLNTLTNLFLAAVAATAVFAVFILCCPFVIVHCLDVFVCVKYHKAEWYKLVGVGVEPAEENEAEEWRCGRCHRSWSQDKGAKGR